MEYVPGRTLKAVIQREPLSEEMAIRVALQLAGAVRAVHHAGLLHCDIKPENIMVADNGQYLKLVDFGISRAYRKRSDAASTHLLATPEYFSPELRAGQYSIQSDIYAFMCVLYQLIVGQPPFTGTSPLEVIQAHCSKAPLSIRMQRPEVSVKLEQIVMQGLDKRPERRQRTMDEVITALGGLHFQERSLTQPQPLRTWTRLAAALLFGVVLAGIMSQPQAVLRAALSEPAWDPVIVQQRLRELQERIDVASRRYHTALTSFPSDPEASAAVREERKRLLQLISTLEAFCQEAFAHATAEEDSHGTRAAILEALTYGRARQQQYAPP
jgi:serine/threonine protein kinase